MIRGEAISTVNILVRKHQAPPKKDLLTCGSVLLDLSSDVNVPPRTSRIIDFGLAVQLPPDVIGLVTLDPNHDYSKLRVDTTIVGQIGPSLGKKKKSFEANQLVVKGFSNIFRASSLPYMHRDLQ